jgi:hypothetical protein
MDEPSWPELVKEVFVFLAYRFLPNNKENAL